MKKLTLLTIFLLSCFWAFAQPANDDCAGATFLGEISDYCSGMSEFSNNNATLSTPPPPAQCATMMHDVWFAFIPTEPGALIELFGQTDISDPNFLEPNLIIYEGDCNALNAINCEQTIIGPDIVEINQTGLLVGELYYLRIDGASEGNFGLCISSFIPVPEPESDCVDAVVLCDKTGFFVESLNGIGNDRDEIDSDCFPVDPGQTAESASSWYTWTCEVSGPLAFTLTPNDIFPGDISADLDFVVYELPNGIGDCSDKIEIRCMGSGANGTVQPNGSFIPDPLNTWSECNGATGLSLTDGDIMEFPGCQSGNNNFASAINMVAGTTYALVINNYSENGVGFSIEFDGSGTFLGPEVDFTYTPVTDFECDKTIVFGDQSNPLTDNIVSWDWSFGNGASMATANTQGPHNIIYSSFGPKTVVLTITSERGCTRTKIEEIFVESCCEDFLALEIFTDEVDPTCFGADNGQISATGAGGDPPYQYSLDGITYQPVSNFNNLTAGVYEVFIQDTKGCENKSLPITLTDPPELIVDAGDDVTVDLGFTHMINATYSPVMANDSIAWCNLGSEVNASNTAGFIDSCFTCLDPTIMPFGTQTFTLKVINEAGCIESDDIEITTNLVKPVYAPNIFSPGNDFDNEFFTLGFGPQIAEFVELLIFNRWGEMVYKGKGLPALQSERLTCPAGFATSECGWDGTINGELVNPGVFAWMAKVRFIDEQPGGKLEIFSGSVTVIR